VAKEKELIERRVILPPAAPHSWPSSASCSDITEYARM
jgi:hypothetical protein